MAIKKFNDSPTISDQIIFDILTPDIDGCFTSNPYKVDKVSIYFIERDFTNNQFGEYTENIYDPKLLQQLNLYKKLACENPGQYIAEVTDLQNQLNAKVVQQSIYYSDVQLVAEFGSPEFPAWLSTDTENSFITNIPVDEDGNVQYGRFILEWSPRGIREGDYFVVWSWTFFPADVPMSQTLLFNVFGDTKLTTSIPTHFTKPDKYETLLERYTPSAVKVPITSSDLTPQVVEGINQSVAKAFTFLEDLANQMPDMLDANVTQEAFLILLSNLFNLKLRSDDPTLWRRQIKNAVPLFKKKGTLNGLIEALAQAGIFLTKFNKLWQVRSKYSWQDYFEVKDSHQFVLSHFPVLPINPDHFQVYWRGDGDWVAVTPDYVSLVETPDHVVVGWQGNMLSMNPIELSKGDGVRIVYQFQEFPTEGEALLDTYVLNLPLGDTRDERDQKYPPKNWNTYLIEEDDPLFSIVVNNKHPYFDSLVFGQVRTEFPYSENIYNMEEYNGSLRDSINPCDIDKEFIDPCWACQSSQFNVNIDIENLSSDRIVEAREIIQEFVPFHSLLHSIQISGIRNDIVQPPIEQIELLAHIKGTEITISGSGQTIFNRIMEEGKSIARDRLARSLMIANNKTATAFNSNISLFSPNIKLEGLGIHNGFCILDVLGLHPNAGRYDISNPIGSHAEVTGVTEPLNQNSFTFRLQNRRLNNASAGIIQQNIYLFNDESVQFAFQGAKTTWDIDHGNTGVAWTVYISDFNNSYTISNILPTGELVLQDNGTLPSSNDNDLSYLLMDSDGNVKHNGTAGSLVVKHQAIVDLSSGANYIEDSFAAIDDIASIIQKGYFAEIDNVQYKITGFTEEFLQFVIADYNNGNSSNTPVVIYQQLAQDIGSFHYLGLNLQTTDNYEQELHIVNGSNPPNRQVDTNLYKENFLIEINNTFYAIADIDGTTISLNGPHRDWTTLTNGGTTVTFNINKFKKKDFVIEERNETADGETLLYTPGADFDAIDRSGKEIISVSENEPPEVLAAALNEDSITETLEQQESITFTIKWAE